MPRTCVFCGGSPLTNEHLWPDWAARLVFDEGPLRHYGRTEREGSASIERGFEKRGFSMTVRAVCARCNNGWMSELEGRAKPLLYPIFRGHGKELHRDGQATLATWALKTLMMCEHANPNTDRVVPAEEYERLYQTRGPSPATRVWMTTYGGDVLGSGRPYGLDLDNRQSDVRGRRDVWGGTITFGPAAFQVFGSYMPSLLAAPHFLHPGVREIWPFHDSFTWMPSPAFDDAGIEQFTNALTDDLRRFGELARDAHGHS